MPDIDSCLFLESTQEEEWEKARSVCVGVDNKVWGEAGFVMLQLDGMVVGGIWSKRTSSDGLREPLFSPKVNILGQQGHRLLRSTKDWHPRHLFALELEHLGRCRNRTFLYTRSLG